jgi:Ca2+:H+ antiporter
MSSSDHLPPTSQSTPSKSRSSNNLLRMSRGSAHDHESGRIRRQSEGTPADDFSDSVVEIVNVNQMGSFGHIIFAGHTEARDITSRSEDYQKRVGRPDNVVQEKKENYVNWSTLTWFLLFGWWLAVPYVLCGMLAYPFSQKSGKRLAKRALYVSWPFGRYLERNHQAIKNAGKSGASASAVLSPASSLASTPRSSKIFVTSPHSAAEFSLAGGSADPLLKPGSEFSLAGGSMDPLLQSGGHALDAAGAAPVASHGHFTNGAPVCKSFRNFIGAFFWYIFAAPPLSLLHLAVAAVCVFTVVLLPMAKMNMVLLACLWERPFDVRVRNVEQNTKGREVLHVTQSGGSVTWCKYSVGGANLFVLNMLVVVLAVTIIPYLLPHESLRTPIASVVFITIALSTIIPLGYLIVQAIASISAQTNFALGAVLNAFFGTIIEVILYAGAMDKPDTGSELVCQGIVGALLCALIMIPGLCMIIGGIRHKEQKFNRVSAGVSSMLLFVALIGVFTPTLFQRVYGGYQLKCESCLNSSSTLLPPPRSGQHSSVGAESVLFTGVNCRGCSYLPTPVIDDSNFKQNTWPLAILVAVFLPAIYVIGLIFTLRTHSYQVDHEEEALVNSRLLPSQDGDAEARDRSESAEHDGGHYKSDWSIKFSVFVLISCTSVFAIISENINELLGIALRNLNISPAFAGMTIIAWVPSAAEIVNAVVFAWRNEISLAIEIGMSATVQIALIQLPMLILLQVVLGAYGVWPEYLFQPIFSTMDIMSVALSVLIINFLSMDGKTNYFKGFTLM